MSERKTKKHRQYTIDEKNEIVQMYLTGETKGIGSLAKDLDVYKSMIERWIKQYQEFGTTVDRRGKSTKDQVPNKGRPKKRIKLEDNDIQHSVSNRGNCVDNCPIESWFSALKTETIYLMDKLSESEMINVVDQYVKYYNEERLQEKIKELAPMKYRMQVLSTLFN